MAFHCIHATITYEQFELLMKGLRFAAPFSTERNDGNVLKLSREACLVERFEIKDVNVVARDREC